MQPCGIVKEATAAEVLGTAAMTSFNNTLSLIPGVISQCLGGSYISKNPAHRIVCQSYWVPRDHADVMTLRSLQTWKYLGPFQGQSAAVVWISFPQRSCVSLQSVVQNLQDLGLSGRS